MARDFRGNAAKFSGHLTLWGMSRAQHRKPQIGWFRSVHHWQNLPSVSVWPRRSPFDSNCLNYAIYGA